MITNSSQKQFGVSVFSEYAITAYFACCRIFRIFCILFSRRKSTFSTAILTFFVFPSPISIRFRYLDHLVANRMAPSMCLHYRGTRWVGFKQFCTIFPPRIWCLYGPHTFLKCRIKLARPISGGPVILQTLSLAGGCDVRVYGGKCPMTSSSALHHHRQPMTNTTQRRLLRQQTATT